jgi:hypothetical protein
MSLDPELETWRQGWKAGTQASAPDLDAIRDEAIRQERKMRRRFAMELGLSFLLLPFSVAFAWMNRSAETILWAAVVWVLTIAASALTVWNWRTLWQDSVHSVQDFTQLKRKRARAALRSVSVGFATLAVNVVIATGWYVFDLALNRIHFPRFCLGIALIVLISVTIFIGLRRRQTKALDELDRIDTVRD